MSDVLGRGVIEVSADSSKLQAGIDDAKRSISNLGKATADANTKASASIDRYVKRLEAQNATSRMSTREAELYKLAMRGASDAQLKAADSALRMAEKQKLANQRLQELSRIGRVVGTMLAAGLVASVVAFDRLNKSVAAFQGLSEKMGDSAVNVASLAVAAGSSGTAMETIAAASNKLTKALTGTEAGGKEAKEALRALGIDADKFIAKAPAERFEEVAKALAGFQDGAEKSAVAMALFGKSGAEIIPFLNDLGDAYGRQNILTAEQIALADEYEKKQQALEAQISLYAGAIATEMLPAFNDLSHVLLDLIKDFGGVRDESGRLDSAQIRSFADDAADALAFLVDVVRGVKFAFQSLGTAIAASMASQTFILKGEFRQALKVLDEGHHDIETMAMAESARDRLQRERARRLDAERKKAQEPVETKKKLTYSLADSEGAENTVKARQEAEIAGIKRAAQEKINALSNAEKIMQAQRSAGLISERAYYAARKQYITEHAKAQEEALQSEINVLSRKNVSGAEQVENLKKIADAQQQLSKIRADAAADLEVLAIQEFAANKKIADALRDATLASEEYIASVRKRNEIEIAGYGMGAKWREDQDGRARIDDKFLSEKSKLDRDLRRNQITRDAYDEYLRIARETYEVEIVLFDQRTTAIEDKQRDWALGASEAMRNYFDEIQNIYAQMESVVSSAFKGMEDALVSFVTTGKLDFKSLVNSIVADMARIMIRQSVTGPLANWLGGLFKFNALGGVYPAPALSAFSNGVYGPGQQKFFAFADGAAIGTFAEPGAGHEAIMPLKRGSDGKLGVQASGSQQQQVNIFVNIQGSHSAPDVRRAAGQGAREALAAFAGAQRYA